MLCITVTAVTAIALGGCVAPLKVERLQEFTPQSKTIVLLNSTRWDSKIRTNLSKNGFKVRRFASQNQVIVEGNDGEIARVFNEAEARYGLTFFWESVDHCIINSSRHIYGTFEITDIQTNEVILVIEKSGWTEACGSRTHDQLIFEDLAGALANAWK